MMYILIKDLKQFNFFWNLIALSTKDRILIRKILNEIRVLG